MYPAGEDITAFYHTELLHYHLAKNYYSLGIQKYQQSSIELAKDHLHQSLHYINRAESVGCTQWF